MADINQKGSDTRGGRAKEYKYTREGAGDVEQISVRIMKVFHLLTRTEPSF